jgi:hypothetical protein
VADDSLHSSQYSLSHPAFDFDKYHLAADTYQKLSTCLYYGFALKLSLFNLSDSELSSLHHLVTMLYEQSVPR